MVHPPFNQLGNKVYEGMPFDEYKALEAANASGLKVVLKTGSHYLFQKNKVEDDESKAKRLGKLVHMAFLEPANFARAFRIYPDFGTGKGSRTSKWDWEKQQLEENPQAILIKEEEATQVIEMCNGIRRKTKAAEILTAGVSEVTITWADKIHGLSCKGRLDYLDTSADRPIIGELKTTRCAEYESFSRDCLKYKFDLSGAHYCEGVRAIYGKEPLLAMIAIESEPPYECQVFSADTAFLDHGFRLRGRALTRLADFIKKQEFPGYSDEIVNLSLPHSAWYDFEEEM